MLDGTEMNFNEGTCGNSVAPKVKLIRETRQTHEIENRAFALFGVFGGYNSGSDCETPAYSRALVSMRMVTGPSFTSATCMSAPNSPDAIGLLSSAASLLRNIS